MTIRRHPLAHAVALAAVLGATALVVGCENDEVEPTPAPMDSTAADGMAPATPPADTMDPSMPPAMDPTMPPTDPSVPQPTDPTMPPPADPTAPMDADPTMQPPTEGTPEPVS